MQWTYQSTPKRDFNLQRSNTSAKKKSVRKRHKSYSTVDMAKTNEEAKRNLLDYLIKSRKKMAKALKEAEKEKSKSEKQKLNIIAYKQKIQELEIMIESLRNKLKGDS